MNSTLPKCLQFLFWFALLAALAGCYSGPGPLPPYTTQLTFENLKQYHNPRWSPDDSRIVYAISRSAREPGIYLINRDGTNIKQLASAGVDSDGPDWSPDGKMIVFESTRNGGSQVFISDAEGSGAEQLTHESHSAGCPRWSPLGNEIAFCGGTRHDQTDLELYIININTKRVRQLTQSDLGRIAEFAWSPDGSRIAFKAERMDIADPESADRGPFLYLINSDGSNLQRLFIENAGFFSPTWSPDGKRLLFSYIALGQSKMPDGFYLMNIDGTGIRRLFNNSTCRDPDWSHTQDKIVLNCEGKYGNLYVLDLRKY